MAVLKLDGACGLACGSRSCLLRLLGGLKSSLGVSGESGCADDGLSVADSSISKVGVFKRSAADSPCYSPNGE